ncbi:MAG: hypothetical protein ACTTJV_09085 [Ottowia sp.]
MIKKLTSIIKNKYQNRAAAGYAILTPSIQNNPPRKRITVQDLRRRKYAIRSSRLERDIPNPAKSGNIPYSETQNRSRFMAAPGMLAQISRAGRECTNETRKQKRPT